jgi:hypothetical protein
VNPPSGIFVFWKKHGEFIHEEARLRFWFSNLVIFPKAKKSKPRLGAASSGSSRSHLYQETETHLYNGHIQEGDFGHNRSRSQCFPSPTGHMLTSFSFEIYSLNSSRMIRNFLESLELEHDIFKLNWLISI